LKKFNDDTPGFESGPETKKEEFMEGLLRLLPMRGALGLLLICLLGTGSVWAEEKPAAPAATTPAAAPAAAEEKKEEAAAAPAAPTVNNGDNAWLLTSAALVLMMTAPGLALFYGGLVRRKNVLSTIMHSVFLMGLVSLLWMVYGYSIAFGEGNAYFGSLSQYFLLKDVGGAPNADYAPTIPHTTFMMFQLMFAIITPALISGAYAERIKFSAMVLFTILWSTFIYFPMAHMVWGKGGLFNWFFDAKIPALDFAGGTVVHITAGITALVAALVLGKRKGYPTTPMLPHSLVLCVTGAALLWVGWFGFNAGSALGAGDLASSAFASTHFAAAMAALSWAGMEWITRGKPSALGVASGIVAGLVAVTPAAGFVTPLSGAIIGLVAGVVCFIAVTKIKIALGYDDSLDAFGVHGVGGILGAILTGVFADPAVNPAIASTYKVNGEVVSLAGGMGQVMNQLMAVGVTVVIAAVGAFIILKIVDVVVGLRVTEEEEVNGLDVSLHGEEGYVDLEGSSSQGGSPVHYSSVASGATKTATASH
jgi:ammonium transporter, Amt family